MWHIHKDIEFCYGHRTYTQKLNGEFSSDLKQACRHFHGHQGKVTIYMSGGELDNQTGMLTDFRHLEWCKKFIDEYIDHQFIMDINDPMFESFVVAPYSKLTGQTFENKFEFYNKACVEVTVPNTDHVVGYRPIIEHFTDDQRSQPEFETIEGITVVDFVPTSEKLSQWMAQMVQAKMSRIGVNVTQVDWWETPKSCATYIRK